MSRSRTLKAPVSWTTLNQQHLVRELARVRALLAPAPDGPPSPLRPRRRGARPGASGAGGSSTAWTHPVPPALDMLVREFGLSSFERDVLLATAALELDGSFAEFWARGPTFARLLAALPDAHWSALTPAGPLRYWQLIEAVTDERPTLAPLRIDERILHQLAGTPSLDERLQATILPLVANAPVSETLRHAADQLRERLMPSDPPSSFKGVLLRAEDSETARVVVQHACRTLGVSAWTIAAEDLPASAGERARLARLWDREAVLGTGLLAIDAEESAPDVAGRIARFVATLRVPVIVMARTLAAGDGLALLTRMEVPSLERNERHALWRTVLGELAPSLNGDVARLAEQFTVSEPAIATLGSVARQAVGDAAAVDAHQAGDDADRVRRHVWASCRAQLRQRANRLVEVLVPRASWSDLVLPPVETETLREIALHVRDRATVYGTWGMGARASRGLGLSALFSGPSGTGKTLAAEVLAGELGLDLYRIDLGQVVSKYIGETEKNLANTFEAAEASGAVLFFDEADALFGKRSEVKDSHDRYANIEVSYLLQRLESYRGLAILATNMQSALDSAFLRRIRFIVEFPFPGPAERTRMWQRAWPVATPVEGIDAGALAALDLSGGSIRSVALHAAFRAANEGGPVRPVHVLHAARREFAKLGKPFTEPREMR